MANEMDAMNPLEVNQVLQLVFSHCDKAELKVCRLVSKKCNEIATRMLQASVNPIRIAEDGLTGVRLTKFLKVLQKSHNPPFVKFDISSGFCITENEWVLLQFFHVCGEFLQWLTICVDRNKNSELKFIDKYLETAQLPKLRYLSFQDETIARSCNEEISPPDVSCHVFFKAIVFAAVNLTRLDLSFPSKYLQVEHDDEESPCIPDSLILKNPHKQLRHLELSARINEEQILTLSKAELYLEILHCRLRNSVMRQSSFRKFLESQSDTLKDLQITEERQGSHFTVEFPTEFPLKNLKVFTLFSACEKDIYNVSFAPFGYQEQLPSLHTLVLWNAFGTEERWAPFFRATSPSTTLRVLELPNHFRNMDMANCLARTFPCLRKIKVGFSLRPENELVLRIIFNTLNTLEEIDIRTDMDNCNQNIDHILTGIPLEVCRRMRKNHNVIHRPDFAEMDLKSLKKYPGLTDLKRLQRLEIVLDNSRPPFITDVTAYLAFAKLENLTHLSFTKCGMSTECCDELKEKFDVCLIPSTGRNFYDFEFLDFDFG